jgi:hypothetical protein
MTLKSKFLTISLLSLFLLFSQTTRAAAMNYFNGVVLAEDTGEHRWTPEGSGCSEPKGVSVTCPDGNCTVWWPCDEYGGHFDASTSVEGEIRVELTPHPNYDRCEWQIMEYSEDGSQSWPTGEEGTGCVATFNLPSGNWKRGVCFKMETPPLPCAENLNRICSANATIATFNWDSVTRAANYALRINREPFDDWVGEGDQWVWVDGATYCSGSRCSITQNIEANKNYQWSVQGLWPDEGEPYRGCIQSGATFSCSAAGPFIFHLVPIWNKITWLTQLPTTFTSYLALDHIENGCPRPQDPPRAVAQRKNGWWESFVRGYGGIVFPLVAAHDYYIKVASVCDWQPGS